MDPDEALQAEEDANQDIELLEDHNPQLMLENIHNIQDEVLEDMDEEELHNEEMQNEEQDIEEAEARLLSTFSPPNPNPSADLGMNSMQPLGTSNP